MATTRTCRNVRTMVAIGEKADLEHAAFNKPETFPDHANGAETLDARDHCGPLPLFIIRLSMKRITVGRPATAPPMP